MDKELKQDINRKMWEINQEEKGDYDNRLFNIPADIPLDWAFYGLVVCSVIGIGFGIYPAWRAASLDPIESLRYE